MNRPVRTSVCRGSVDACLMRPDAPCSRLSDRWGSLPECGTNGRKALMPGLSLTSCRTEGDKAENLMRCRAWDQGTKATSCGRGLPAPVPLNRCGSAAVLFLLLSYAQTLYGQLEQQGDFGRFFIALVGSQPDLQFFRCSKLIPAISTPPEFEFETCH